MNFEHNEHELQCDIWALGSRVWSIPTKARQSWNRKQSTDIESNPHHLQHCLNVVNHIWIFLYFCRAWGLYTHMLSAKWHHDSQVPSRTSLFLLVWSHFFCVTMTKHVVNCCMTQPELSPSHVHHSSITPQAWNCWLIPFSQLHLVGSVLL